MLTKSDLMYDLPERLIAQDPPASRGTCRLMVLNRDLGTIAHTAFGEIGGFLAPEDLLVLNDTRVINARLRGVRIPSGGSVELLLLEKLEPLLWRVMIRPGRRCRKGNVFSFRNRLTGTTVEELGMGRALVVFDSPGNTMEVLERTGTIPIPPYIKREPTRADDARYQTVFARENGAVAAPTAGLHFTPEILESLKRKGISIEYLTLHVGPGTFQPLRREVLSENTMEEERYVIPGEVVAALRKGRAMGGRIVAAGTTVTRALESVELRGSDRLQGKTSIFIHPPYSFRNVDLLLTNFHLPGSSLISLVGSFAGLDFLMEAYCKAIENNYMFYSYGDAMLII